MLGCLTKNLDIRLAEPADKAWFEKIFRDSEIMRTILNGTTMDEQRVEEASSRAVSQHLKGQGLGYFVIRFLGKPENLGYVVLRKFNWIPGFEEETEMGYIIDRAYWGRGIASQATAAALCYVRDTLKLDRLLALVRDDNSPSVKIVQRHGFKKLDVALEAYPGNSIWEIKFE